MAKTRYNPLERKQEVALSTDGRPTESLCAQNVRTDGGTQMRAGLNEDVVQEYFELLNELDTWPFPPVEVYYDGETYWLADGFHRVEAARRVGDLYLFPAIVRAGDRRDAILSAAKANAKHGLRRTNADKRRAIETLLGDEEWGKWSDREIARRCNVSAPLVAQVRAELLTVNSYSDEDYNERKDGRNERKDERNERNDGRNERNERKDGRNDERNDERNERNDGRNERNERKDGRKDERKDERTYTTRHGTEATMRVGGIGKRRKPEDVAQIESERSGLSKREREDYIHAIYIALTCLQDMADRELHPLASYAVEVLSRIHTHLRGLR